MCVGATLGFVCVSVCERARESERECMCACFSFVPSALVPKAALTQCAPTYVYLGIPEMDNSSKFDMSLKWLRLVV